MTRVLKAGYLHLVVLLCLVFCGLSFGGTRSGDGEYWQIHEISHDIDDTWKVTISEEFRLGQHNGNPYLHNIDVGLVYKNAFKGVDIGLNFKKEYEKDSAGKFRHENRPHLNMMFRGKLFGLETSNRIRLEYRNLEHKKDVWRFRNKITVNLPFELTLLKLQPFVAEEFFFNLGEDNVNQNRLYSGFSFPVAKNLKARLFYMWKHSKISGGWRDTNVIGTSLKFKF